MLKTRNSILLFSDDYHAEEDPLRMLLTRAPVAKEVPAIIDDSALTDAMAIHARLIERLMPSFVLYRSAGGERKPYYAGASLETLLGNLAEVLAAYKSVRDVGEPE